MKIDFNNNEPPEEISVGRRITLIMGKNNDLLSLAGDQLGAVMFPLEHLHPRHHPTRITEFLDDPRPIVTHSEMAVLALQKLVREQQLFRDDVGINVISEDERGGYVVPMLLNTDGSFRNAWPGGFFPQRLEMLQ